jgi:branched-subunit amino acid transport protein
MDKDILPAIIVMAFGTYGARVLPFVLFRKKKVGGIVKSFIQLVPVALLAALVVPEFVLSQDNRFSLV